MENVKNFFTATLFDSPVTVWMVFVAAAALIIILGVAIGIGAGKKRKRKKALAETANKESQVNVQDNADSLSAALGNEDDYLADSSLKEEIEADIVTDMIYPSNDGEELKEPVIQERKETKEPEDVESITLNTESAKSSKQENAKATETTENITVKQDQVKSSERVKAKASETKPEQSDAAIVSEAAAAKAPAKKVVAKKVIAPTTSDNDKKAKVVGTEALPKKIKNNLKLEEVKAEAEQVQEHSDMETFGKFFIIRDEKANPNKPFKFALRANNGQLLFESEPYKAKPREASINAFKKHVQVGDFVIDEDKFGLFRFKLYTDTGKLIGVGESYKTRAACTSSIDSVKRFSISATQIEDTTISDETPQE